MVVNEGVIRYARAGRRPEDLSRRPIVLPCNGPSWCTGTAQGPAQTIRSPMEPHKGANVIPSSTQPSPRSLTCAVLRLGLAPLALWPMLALGAILTVDSASDVVDPGDGALGLREAIAAAAPGDEIRFAPSVTHIVLGGTQLTVDKDLTLAGPGPGGLTLDGAGLSRVLNTLVGTTVTLRGLTVTGGDTTGIRFGDTSGAGILNHGTMTLVGVVLTGNTGPANRTNAALSSEAANGGLQVQDCVVRDNTGEGIRVQEGPATLVHSTVSGNTGGGLVVGSGSTPVLVLGSTFTGNGGVIGGGVNNGSGFAPITLVNSTVSGNTTSWRAGGIWAGSAPLTLINTTVTANQAATQGGGIMASGDTTPGVSVTLRNSIVAGNSAPQDSDCAEVSGSGLILADHYNLLGAGGGCPAGALDVTVADTAAVLGPLADNGGPVQTHALIGAANPTIDGGDPAGCLDQEGLPLDRDQRGAPRPAGITCDMGAYETGPPRLMAAPDSHDFGEIAVGESAMAIVTLTNGGNEPLTVTGLALGPSGGAFSLEGPPALPLTLAFAETLDIQLAFAPQASGAAAAELLIDSDDPDTPQAGVALSGTGMATELPPAEQIADILAFYDDAIAQGTLVGTGRRRAARRRPRALRHKLVAIGRRIRHERLNRACRQLFRLSRRIDGVSPPPDFVQGPALGELAAKVRTLSDTLACTR